MQIDKELIKTLRGELQSAVDKVCARYGLNAEQQKNITYHIDRFSIRFDITDGEIDFNKKQFDNVCFMYGLRPEHYGETFHVRGKECIITGINTRAKKYPINFTQDGKPMKGEKTMVMEALRQEGKL